MTERQPIFRAEALEHKARPASQGGLLRGEPRWASWAFWALLALVIGGIVAGSVIEIDRYAQGTTTIDDAGRVVVLLPAALAPEVAIGRPVTVEGEKAEVVSSGQDLLYPSEIRERYGIGVPGPSVVLVTSATTADGPPGSARVLIESEPLIVALVPGLKGLFGDDGG